jgi:hypothetical protein
VRLVFLRRELKTPNRASLGTVLKAETTCAFRAASVERAACRNGGCCWKMPRVEDGDRGMVTLMTSVMSNEGWKEKQHLTRLVAERDEQSFRKLAERRVGKAVAG